MTNYDPDSMDFFHESWNDADQYCMDCGGAISATRPEALQPHRATVCQDCWDEQHKPVVSVMVPGPVAAWRWLLAAVWGLE